jgi:CzcA family heavy metal efflux pump
MTISKLAVDNKVTIFILLAIIIIAGAYSYVTIPRESSPSITIPYVFISTVYPGVSPEDIENLVTQKIENEVNGISDIKEITSTSQESFSSVVIEFNPNVEIQDALQKVRDKVSIAKTDMPKDIDEPVISEINFSELPILYVNLSGNFGLAKLKDIGDNLSEKLEGIPGILDVDVTGGLEREVKVNADADRMKYYRVSFDDIIYSIQNENRDIPGGGIDVGSSKYTVRVQGELGNPDLINNLIIKKEQGKPIYVNDVAKVIYGFKERTSFARKNGVENVTLIIKKSSGENIIDVIEEVKAVIEKEKKNLPKDLQISFTGDESEFIKTTVHELENGVMTGFLLVTLVLFSVMGFRNAIFVAAAIPLSFLISFCILSIMGITLNMVVLFGLILVLGIIVDDAVVVTENIYRLQEKEGYNPHDASIEGPREVQTPVVIATLTIISAFAPMLFYPGIMGDFMKYLPITVIICLSSSLFVALILNPVFASQFINYKKLQEKAKKSKFAKYNILTRYRQWFEGKFHNFTDKYEKVLRFCLNHRKKTIAAAVAILILVFVFYGMFNKGVQFFPEIEPQTAYIFVTLPVGTSIEKTNEITKIFEEKLPQFKDIEYYVSNVGQEIGFLGGGAEESNKSTITISFYDKEDREENSLITYEEIRKAIEGITTAEVRMDKQSGGPPTQPPVNIEISGDDFEILGQLSEQIQREIKDVPGIADMKDDYEKARPEIRFRIDREKAALYKLNTSVIASTIRTAISGTEASKYRVGEDEYDITVRLDTIQRNDIEYIQNLYISDKDGFLIPLTSVADVTFTAGAGDIKRKDLKRVVTISANAEGRLGNDVLTDVINIIKDLKLPEGYSIDYTGEQEMQKESEDFLTKAFFIAILLVFFFMVMEFNSVGTPLIIMFTVVLSIIGVLIGLLVVGLPFGIVMTGVGVISLSGLVVRNAIILLDFQKVLEKRGLSLMESIIQSGKIRLRPVLLTAITTIFGLLPLTTGVDFDWRTFSWIIGGQNTAFWQPMGVAIIFGLGISTFMTLIIAPVMFVSYKNLLAKFQKKKVITEELPETY